MTDEANNNDGAEEFVNEALKEGELKEEIAKLAALPDGLYEINRRPEADRLGMRVSALDALVREERAKQRKAKKHAAPKFETDELQHSADHIIQQKNILDLFAREIGKVIAGESANARLLYLVATSRLFDKPMNAAIKGTSAGGKSELRKRVLDFLPPEDVIVFTSLSERALIYDDRDYAHKVLSMGEASATEEQQFQDYLLRELMSEGCIRHSTATKVGNEIQTIVITKEGPVAFIVTTTRNLLNQENETRLTSLEVDDSSKQTRLVLDKVAHVDGLHDVAQIDYQPWQDFQRWLGCGECRVIVPFAKVMAELMPAASVRLRRDIGQVIRAIQAHALLHRSQRTVDDAGRILADIENDYAAVRELMNSVVAESAGVAVNPHIVETIDAVAKATIGMLEAEGASAQDVARELKLDKSAAWRRLSAARHGGFIVNLEQRKGMPGRYRVSGQRPEPIDILPPAAVLAERFNTHTPPTPPKPAQPCNRDEIAEEFLGDNGCKDGCNPGADCTDTATADAGPVARLQTVANGLATVKSLDGNGKSPPVARLHGFSGGVPEEVLVCEHCGEPSTSDSPVLFTGVNGETFLLHARCRDDWLDNADLTIPAFLTRKPAP